MYKLGYEEIVERIKEDKGLSEAEIEQKIKEKRRMLSDMISKEGAAHIIANEYGIKVYKDVEKKQLKVKDLFPGLRSVAVLVKVVRKYEVREFDTGKRKGRVASFLAGDETGVLRIVLWDEGQINLMQELKEGDVVKITMGNVRDNQGFKEMHLVRDSKFIINPEDETIEEEPTQANLIQIKDLKGNEMATIRGTVTQIFEPRFYEACPECNKKVVLENGKFNCSVHGNVAEKVVPVVNIVLDDGTGNIRVAFFRDMAMDLMEIKDVKEMQFDEIKENLLGSELTVTGRASKNEMYNNLEFRANSFEYADPVKLANELLK